MTVTVQRSTAMLSRFAKAMGFPSLLVHIQPVEHPQHILNRPDTQETDVNQTGLSGKKWREMVRNCYFSKKSAWFPIQRDTEHERTEHPTCLQHSAASGGSTGKTSLPQSPSTGRFCCGPKKTGMQRCNDAFKAEDFLPMIPGICIFGPVGPSLLFSKSARTGGARGVIIRMA